MSFSISPEILSPANPPATPTPLPLPQSSPPAPMEQIVSPFPSPLPPEKTADSSPPAVPPAKSPATDNPPPPVDLVSPPPPDATLSPPLPAPEIPPSTESSPPPPPAAPLPVPTPPSPILTSPVPPEAVSPSPPPPPPPLPESPPPPEPSPDEKATPPAPQAPKNKNSPPPKRASVITAPPPKSPPSPSPPLSPEENPEASPLQQPPPRSLPNSNKTTASPTLASPPASAGRSLPAAVQIRKAEPNLRLSPGFIAGCAVVSLVVIAVFACVVSCVVCYKRHRRRTKGIGLPQHYHPKAPSLGRKEKFSISTLPTLHPPPIKSSSVAITASTDSGPGPAGHGTLSYGQLAAATGGFSEVNLVGEGGFGCVFKGVLPGGREVAVKQLRTGSRQGEREFRAEVEIISRIHHKHLVSLVGYCINGNERLLVYEFVPNNTLDFHLYGKQEHVMEWETRLKIAIGSAKGLAYLHEDCNPKVIHRDIKASNILLDFSFEAKVSDFGLAKSFSDTNANISHISTRVVGTFGYLAPEYASSGKVTEKSDVYSYGVVLLELITGKPPISSMNQGLVEWARPLLAQAMEDGNFDSLVDPQLQRNYNPDEMSRMVTCAAACVRHSAWLRPRMSQIVHALEGHASLTNFHEGLTPGSSTLYGSPSSSYNAQQYTNDLNKFHRAVVDQEHGNESTCSGSTSEYGLNPSVSSGEMPSRRFRN